jgi:fatty-acid desaturase
MATLIGNRGPLWWSSKHMRHHKYCENEGEYPHNDPHSHFRYGWWYGYIVSKLALPPSLPPSSSCPARRTRQNDTHIPLFTKTSSSTLPPSLPPSLPPPLP